MSGQIDVASHRPVTQREASVLKLMADGYSNQEIAYELEIGVETVKTYAKLCLRKLRARNRTHAVVLALRRGIIE